MRSTPRITKEVDGWQVASSPENDLPWRSAETVWPVIIR